MVAEVRVRGMDGARSAEDAWQVLEPLLPEYGITRVADLTGLDVLGVPVWAAVRPAALTLSVSQGKGATGRAAAVSAVMEALELWHVEQRVPVRWRGVSARELGLPYPVGALPQRVPHPGLDGVPVDWAAGTGLVDGGEVPVPVGLVQRTVPAMWEPVLWRATSTGIACGTSRAPALLHALYEVVERHVLHADELHEGGRRRWFGPGTVEDRYVGGLVGRIQEAGAVLELASVEGQFGLPVCLAFLWSDDYPVWFAGSGCHHDPHVALSRAITEAAQSRLTCISGVRDDLPSSEAVFDTVVDRPTTTPGLPAWDPDRVAGHWSGSLGEQATYVAGLLQEVTGYQPLAVPLSAEDSPVVALKVIAPGATSRTRAAVIR
jgi:ribosomal protein S12 methylthiotransferase accessory factor